MSFKRDLFVVTLAALASQACTGRSPRTVEIGDQKPVEQPGSTDPAVSGPTTDASMELDKEELVKASPSINVHALTYKFTYLTASLSDAVTFDAAGKAQIQLRGLPSGQSGAATLEILEGGTVKFRGTKDPVMLAAGQANRIDITLAAVGPGTGTGTQPGVGTGTTDLTIDVTLQTNPGGSNPGTGGTGTAVNPVNPGTGTGIVTNPGTGTGTGVNPVIPVNPDPVADWDGKSFRGNTKWNIVPVNG
jgi:hypothetical protein